MFEIKVMVVKNNFCCASLKGILRQMVVHQSFTREYEIARLAKITYFVV